MFTDIGISASLTERFNADLELKKIKLSFPVTLMILQAGAWPLSAPLSATNNSTESLSEDFRNYSPPEFLHKSIELFEIFYNSNHSGRKLFWLYHNSSGNSFKLLKRIIFSGSEIALLGSTIYCNNEHFST